MVLRKRLLFFLLVISAAANAQERLYHYTFFNNSRMPGSYFYSKTGLNGTSVKNIRGKLPLSDRIFHTPGNSLQLEYTNRAHGQWKAFVYRQNIRGQDYFRRATYLSFWIYKSAAATGAADLPTVHLVSRDSSIAAGLDFAVKEINSWRQVIIPITLDNNNNPASIIGVCFTQKSRNGKKHTLYIDDIEFIADTQAAPVKAVPKNIQAKGWAKHVDVSWPEVVDTSVRFVKIYRSTDQQTFTPVGIQPAFTSRYADFTGHTSVNYSYKISYLNDLYRESPLSSPVSASTRPITDEQMLDMVQEAAFRYYWEGAEKNSGLAKENIPGRHNMIATGASGFGMMAIIVGAQRAFITREAATDRFVRIVNFLERAETFHGAYAHFVDGPTGKVETFFGKRDNGGDLVETSFLMQGLLTARAYFDGSGEKEKLIRDKITAIWNKVEWDWYRQYPDSKFLYWHWSPDQAWVINHNLIGWNETMVTYLLAIASPTHAIPASMYYTGWANQDSTGRQYRSAWGGTDEGSMYTNGNTYFGIRLDVGVSNGGPLFFTHYSYLGYDPKLITDKYTNYFKNNQNIALINHRYCVQNPGKYKGYGDSCWGLTASDGPFSYAANEPVLRQDRGVIAPTGAISSFPYTPVESMKALKNYYNNYGHFLWGEYGFRDAFSLNENWCTDMAMGLNQAPMTVMIENYRTGLLWKLLMSDKDVQAGMKRLNAETNK